MVAVLFPKVEVIFSLTGSTSSTLTSFIFPPLFYLKLNKNGWFNWKNLFAYLLIIFGIVFGLTVTTITILKDIFNISF
jgi:amino acid permease